MIHLLKPIDAILDRITMYRLVLYVLTALVLASVVEGALGILSYSPVAILLSVVLATASGWAVNEIGARIVRAATSVESVYVTAFIVALIMPPAALGDTKAALMVIAASAIAMASKYVFAPYKKHIFNPAALGVAVTGIVWSGYASWWVAGNLALLPFVLLGGLAVVHKIRRFDLVITFTIVALVTIALTAPGMPLMKVVSRTFLHTSLLFFASIMLTEPLTTPPTRRMRLIYGALVGILFAPAVHIATIYFSPELALLVGNIFAFVVSPKGRHILTLTRVEDTSASTKDFVFTSDHAFTYKPGQFLEWTLPHEHPDSRGTRRFFTIASAPTEGEIRLGVKFYPKPSTFKQTLAALVPGDKIFAAALGGEFILPKDAKKKLVFIAGGIGITPFRSHVRSLLDTNDARDIALFYANRSPGDIAYQSLLDEAQKRFGAQIVHVVNEGALPGMHTGVIDATLLTSAVPDYKERIFYISGPQVMVTAMKRMLRGLGVPHSQIHTDYFVGLA